MHREAITDGPRGPGLGFNLQVRPQTSESRVRVSGEIRAFNLTFFRRRSAGGWSSGLAPGSTSDSPDPAAAKHYSSSLGGKRVASGPNLQVTHWQMAPGNLNGPRRYPAPAVGPAA